MKTSVSSIPFFILRMRHRFISKVQITLLMAILILSGISFGRRVIAARQPSLAPNQGPQEELPNLRGQEAVDQLKEQGLYSSLQKAMAAARYEALWANRTGVSGMGGAYELQNPANNFRAYVDQNEMRVLPLKVELGKSWQLGLKLSGLGYGDAHSSIAAGQVKATGNRVEISRQSAIGTRRSAIVEWFENSGRGLEHGFDISNAPGERKSGEALRMRFDIVGDLKATLNGAQNGVVFTRDEGNVVLSYDKLFAQDAKGRALTSRMTLESERLVIEVEDAGAEYPLRVDPLLTQQVELTADDGDAASHDQFGRSVAISGDTVAVGAPFGNPGSVSVFVRSGTVWSTQQQLLASDGADNDAFGYSVAISGDTVVVGAAFDDQGAATDQGSAYVFVRSGAVWSQQRKLLASDGASDDQFGISVAVSGETVVVGAYLDDQGAATDQGSAYIFVRSGTVWSQQRHLFAGDGAMGDFFGLSVAISGDTAVVGASGDDVGPNDNQGSAYVFIRSGTVWSQQQQFFASDGMQFDRFGFSVGISSDTVVVGAPQDNVEQGSAYVFVRSGTVWSEQQQLLSSDGTGRDDFGHSVAITGETIVVGANLAGPGIDIGHGSAYVFARSDTVWSEQQKLLASDGADDDWFGVSVAVSGDTVLVGAYFHTVGLNLFQGSAYVFDCGRSEQAQVIADDGAANDQFGFSVAISGETVVVGAPLDHEGGNALQGSAYVFVRSGTGWLQQWKLSASDGAAGDGFGYSVAISGDTVVVGSVVGGDTNQGAAYVFVRSGTTWLLQQKVVASDGVADDNFGCSTAISGDTIVVGAFGDDIGASPDRGSAYVFVRSGSLWSQQQQLVASDGLAGDSFGVSVAIGGETIVVGAFLDDVGGNPDQGSAYVFVRTGAFWSQQQQLLAGDGLKNDSFGSSVGISGDTAVVGAYLDDVGTNADQGSAYVFVRSGLLWTQTQQLLAIDGAPADNFGRSAAISGGSVVIGAFLDNVGANADQGSAYVFVRFESLWTQTQQLTASDGASNDRFGQSVAITGETVVAGALLDDVAANEDQGSAYVFFSNCNTAPIMTAAAPLTRQQGSAAVPATIATVRDHQDPAGSLAVSVVSAAPGISISALTNINGTVTAIVAASCTAAVGTNPVVLQARDRDGAVSSVQLFVNVSANTLPTLGSYADTSVSVLGSTAVISSFPPSDNGTIVNLSATSPTFSGSLGANPVTGVVSAGNARPGGTHIITVTATDNCGATLSQGFVLTVTCQAITVTPTTIPAATAGTPYSQLFDHTGGIGAVTFSLSGTLPTGMSFQSPKLEGTPTQIGNFPITVIATDVNGCTGSRNYTLTINAPMLVWTGNTNSDWHTPANWSPNATPTSFHDVLIPTAGVLNQPTISASSSVIHAMTVQTGRVLTINSSRQLVTQGDITSSGQITGGGLLGFEGATFTQNGAISVAAVQFNAGSHALTGGGEFASGIVTVLGGATVALTSNHSVSVLVINSGGVFDATNRALTLTGAGTPIFNSGSITATDSTIIYQGSIAQVVTANINYNNLTINNGAGVFMTGDTTVNGLLNLTTDLTTGSFILTMPPGGTSTGSGDVIGNVKRTGFTVGGAALSFGNALNTIQINSGPPQLDITMNLVKLSPFGFSNCVSRTYNITVAGGSGYSATMRLRYKDTDASGLDETSFQLWHYEPPNWLSPPGAATRNVAQNWVEETGITQFSQWAIAGGPGPICGVLSPNSQFFGIQGAERSIVVTALGSCAWTAVSNASWLEVTSSESGSGTDIVTYVVRDNFAPSPRQATLTIAGQPFTVVQDSEAGPDCLFSVTPGSATFNASGGVGSIDVITEERCAWQAVSNDSWITITSKSCGIANGTVSYTVAANTGTSGRGGSITIAGRTFTVKQKKN